MTNNTVSTLKSTGYNNPSPGLTRGGSAALTLAGWLLEPEKPSAKPHIIVWQLTTNQDKESARDTLVKAFSVTSQKAATAFGMETWVKEHIQGQAAMKSTVQGKNTACCSASYSMPPDLWSNPQMPLTWSDQASSMAPMGETCLRSTKNLWALASWRFYKS